MDLTTISNFTAIFWLLMGVISPPVFRGMVLVLLYFIAIKVAA